MQGTWLRRPAREEDDSMNGTNPWTLRVTYLMIAAAIFATPPRTFAAEAKETIHEGEQLFVRRFVAGQPQPKGGDGLGPLFNHISCAACHRQGALGGGGAIEFNVSL